MTTSQEELKVRIVRMVDRVLDDSKASEELRTLLRPLFLEHIFPAMLKTAGDFFDLAITEAIEIVEQVDRSGGSTKGCLSLLRKFAADMKRDEASS